MTDAAYFLLAILGGSFSLFIVVLVAGIGKTEANRTKAERYRWGCILYMTLSLVLTLLIAVLGSSETVITWLADQTFYTKERLGLASLLVVSIPLSRVAFNLIQLAMVFWRPPMEKKVSSAVKDRLKERRATRHR